MTTGRLRLPILFVAAAFLLFLSGTLTDCQTVNEGAGANFIFKVCGDLDKYYVNPDALNYHKLLNAALEGMSAELKKNNIEFVPKKIDLNIPRIEARDKFIDEFERAKEAAKGNKDIGKNDLAFAAAAALLNSLDDSHTYFIPPKALEESRKRRNGEVSYAGIGIRYKQLEEDFFYVTDVFSGGPADKAGIKRFDRLTAVDGKKVGKTTKEISDSVRGAKGVSLELTVERQGKELKIKIERDNIAVPIVKEEIIKNGDDTFGYILLYSFESNEGYDKMVEYLEKFEKEKVKGIILDLRGNPGGSLRVLQAIAGLFLPSETDICAVKDRYWVRNYSVLPPCVTDLPLTILADETSGSAAEVMAAIIQETGRGKIVGIKTAGAVNVGNVKLLDEEAAMMVTVAWLFTPKGKVLEKQGCSPDIVSELTKDSIKEGKDAQLDACLKFFKETIKPAH